MSYGPIVFDGIFTVFRILPNFCCPPHSHTEHHGESKFSNIHFDSFILLALTWRVKIYSTTFFDSRQATGICGSPSWRTFAYSRQRITSKKILYLILFALLFEIPARETPRQSSYFIFSSLKCWNDLDLQDLAFPSSISSGPVCIHFDQITHRVPQQLHENFSSLAVITQNHNILANPRELAVNSAEL